MTAIARASRRAQGRLETCGWQPGSAKRKELVVKAPDKRFYARAGGQRDRIQFKRQDSPALAGRSCQ